MSEKIPQGIAYAAYIHEEDILRILEEKGKEAAVSVVKNQITFLKATLHDIEVAINAAKDISAKQWQQQAHDIAHEIARFEQILTEIEAS